MLQSLRPSFAQGFARSAAESANPGFWDGLVGCWAPCLGPTGNGVWDIVHQNDAGLTNMDPAADWVQSPEGWALDLDGTNDMLVVPDAPSLALGQALSFLIRFRFSTSPTDYDRLAMKVTSGSWNDGWGVWYQSNTVKFFIDNYATNRAQVALSGSSRDWHTLIGTWDGSTIRLFLDGAEGTPDTYSGTPTSSNEDLAFGAGKFGSGGYMPVEFSVMLLANVGWSVGTVRQLTVDPYALLRLRRRVFAAPAPALTWPGSLIARSRSVSVTRERYPSRFFLAPPARPTPYFISAAARKKAAAQRFASQVLSLAALRGKWFLEARGKYRVFNDAEFRFYRSNSGPPAESDTPFATASSLPATPADTFADGTWYLSMSYFNGVLDSGFLPIGTQGETYLVLEVSGGIEVGDWPLGPRHYLSNVGGGVVRISAMYWEFVTGANRADEWAIAWTSDPSSLPPDPPVDTPDITQSIGSDDLARLEYDLPAQADGTFIKVRVQVRRNDGGWVYSANSTVLLTAADAQAPATPLAIDRWPGPIPEDL